MPGLRHIAILFAAVSMTALSTACSFSFSTDPPADPPAAPEPAAEPAAEPAGADPVENPAAELSQEELDASLQGYVAYEDAYIKMLQAHGSEESGAVLLATTTEDGPQRAVAEHDIAANQETPLTVDGWSNIVTADLVESDLADPERVSVVLDTCLDSTGVEIAEIEDQVQFSRSTVTMHRIADTWLVHELAYEPVDACE